MAFFFSRRSSAAAPAGAVQVAATCFHCGEALPPNVAETVDFEGTPRPVCCAGCAAVFNLMIRMGHGSYYRDRESA